MESYVIQLLLTYKYVVLIPIGFIEGHLISLIAGFLSKLGYLNPFLAGACIASGNLIGDVCLYWLGFHKGKSFSIFLEKWFGISEGTIDKGIEVFHTRTNSILFLSKVTNGFGMAMAILFGAGVARIPFRQYMLWNILGESVWTGILVSLGYYFGALYQVVDTTLLKISLITGVMVCTFLVFVSIRRYLASKFKV